MAPHVRPENVLKVGFIAMVFLESIAGGGWTLRRICVYLESCNKSSYSSFSVSISYLD